MARQRTRRPSVQPRCRSSSPFVFEVPDQPGERARVLPGDLQYWDISDRGDPTSADGEPHTHIQREVATDDPDTDENERWESFDFLHNATVSWDGSVVAAVDESGGGVEPRCDGDDTKRGFTWFYPLVEPGTPVNGFDELGRYIIPRPQNSEVCVSHNGNVLPTADGSRQQVQAFYQGGNSWIDSRTRPLHEIRLGGPRG